MLNGSVLQYLHLALTVLGWGISIGVLRATISSHNERIANLEKCEASRNTAYVPRAELELHLQLIAERLASIKDLLGRAEQRNAPNGERN